MTPATFIDTAWQKGLAALRPTNTQLEHGLALHHELGVCDNYGFLPKAFTPEVRDGMNAMQDRGMGAVEWKQKSWALRLTAATRDARGAAEIRAALDRAAIRGMVQNVSDVGESLEYAVMNLAAHRHLCTVFQDCLVQATGTEDLDAAKASGRLGVVFSLTGLPLTANALMDPQGWLDWIEVWYQFGVRFMHLGYNRRNYLADGCTEPRDGGLSDFGREVIARMNRTGIVVDLPHSSPLTSADAVACSAKPVVASHAGCRGIHDHPRCKSDEEIKAIAGSGGVLGIVAVPSLLGPNADINLLLQHVQYALDLVGGDHVAIGTDLGYQRPWPQDIRPFRAAQQLAKNAGGWKATHSSHASQEHLGGSLTWTNWPLFTVGLVKLGLSDHQIAAVLGGNLRRILRACRPSNEQPPAQIHLARLPVPPKS